MDGADPAGQSLLAVFAHPDDESLASGGLLAWCASLGIRVSVLCLSRGEVRRPDDAGGARMGNQRGLELEAAGRVLGLHEVIVRDYRDGFLPWEDPAALESDIRAVITRTHPGVVVTFDHDGLYWHPDHIAVHERTTAAVAGLGEAGPALFYVSMPPGAMQAALDAVRLSVAGQAAISSTTTRVLDIEADAFGTFTTPPTVRVDAGAFAAQKLAALRCHRSQIAGDALDYLTDEDAARVLGLELYRRAEVGARGETFVDRLGCPV